MRKWIVLLTVFLLGIPSLALAQCSSDPDEICIFWSADCTECPNCLAYYGGIVTAYVVLMNSSTSSGISGFEFQLVNA